MQYTYNPEHNRFANPKDGGRNQINRSGFLGPDYSYKKSDGVIRIACLGGSTTARSYPKEMEALLNRWNQDLRYRFEALNFGVGGYNTANSLVNFVLNVVDFDPDYVVIHHTWNEHVVRNTDEEFRSDYTHILTYFHEPVIPDRMLIRGSIIYRWLRFKIAPRPRWAGLGAATNLKTLEQLEEAAGRHQWKNLDELKPFRRNIKTILDLARLRQIRPVLTTQPHSTNPNMAWSYCSTHIDQCNAIVRELRGEYENQVLFVDVDSAMTGRMDSLFTDVGHTNEAGYWVRADLIGRVIFADWKTRQDSLVSGDMNK